MARPAAAQHPRGIQDARRSCFLTRRMRYFRAPAPPTEMSENQNDLIMRLLPRRPSRKSRGEGLFCHYMAQNGLIFPSESGLGWKNPRDGTAVPRDVSENPSHGCTLRARRKAEISLKGARTRLSALTLCQMAHKGRQFLETSGQHHRNGRTAYAPASKKKEEMFGHFAFHSLFL